MNPIEVSESFEELYENAPCGFLSFLNDGLIVKANQTLLDWIGRERAEVVYKLKFQDLITVGEQIFFETHLFPLIHAQGEVAEIHFNLRTQTAARIPVLVTTKKTVSAEQIIVNRMVLFEISDRKKFESELKFERQMAEKTAKAKADFLAVLSHEIRTPLNAVIGVSNLLDSTMLSVEQQPFMEMLRSSSDNLMNLLNSILDLSKINAGKVTVDKKEFHLLKFIDSNVLGWRGLAQKKNIDVIADVEEGIPNSVIGDPLKMTQILSNLIGNAIKFTFNGTVRLKVSLISKLEGRTRIRFEVHDSGIGIAPEKLALIFEEFSQADTDTTSRFGGTGLGLTISQKLANVLGTHIEVKSTPKVGSIFSFDLDLELGDPAANTHSIERVANQTDALRGLKVLVADDSVDNLELMRHLFKKWGTTIETAKTGIEAIEKVKATDFDVVLMDVRMPVMNGYVAAVTIRSLAERKKREVPIIAFSGSTTFDGHDIANDGVFDSMVGKPFKPVELVAKLLRFTKPSS